MLFTFQGCLLKIEFYYLNVKMSFWKTNINHVTKPGDFVCSFRNYVSSKQLLTILIFFSENQDCLHHVVHERLGELLRVLKAIISKHPSLNSVDLLSAAGTVIAKVKGKGMGEPWTLHTLQGQNLDALHTAG